MTPIAWVLLALTAVSLITAGLAGVIAAELNFRLYQARTQLATLTAQRISQYGDSAD